MHTILIADDDQDIRAVIRAKLEMLGYRLIEASHGDQALELARAERPDLLLIDWMMPGITGIEVVQRLRQEPSLKHIPVIIMTGKEGPSYRRQALELGVTVMLMKPFSPSEVAEKIRSVLK